jgi:hypothetical protein
MELRPGRFLYFAIQTNAGPEAFTINDAARHIV